jgi:hypothetical protein
MEIDEAIRLLEDSGIAVFLDKNLIEGDNYFEDCDYIYDGRFPEFVSKIKSCGLNHVFVMKKLFFEEEFFVESRCRLHKKAVEMDRYRSFERGGIYIEDKEEDKLDIRRLDKEFLEYSKNVNKTCVYKISSFLSGKELSFIYEMDWFKSFIEKKKFTIVRLDEIQQENYNKYLDEKNKENIDNEKCIKEIENKLDDLINDEDFLKLKTQKSMLVYAYEKIEDLDELDEKHVKFCMQKLFNKVSIAKYKK